MSNNQPGFNTLAIHAGAQPDPATGARATPIYQTTLRLRRCRSRSLAVRPQGLRQHLHPHHEPDPGRARRALAALEGGTAALAVASGHAAQLLVFHTIMSPGDNFIAANRLYGGSINQFGQSFKSFDWHVRWADPADMGSIEAQIDDRTKAIFIESLANPGGTFVTDIKAIAEVARKHGLPLIVDNTMASPYLIQPIEHGADIVVHSLTKFIGGHGNSMGGVIVDGGSFDWSKSGKYPMLSSRARNMAAWCCTRPSAISPSPSLAACWACATSARPSRRSTPS
jgi:O-acetylhomoserine (thiol)-lyase